MFEKTHRFSHLAQILIITEYVDILCDVVIFIAVLFPQIILDTFGTFIYVHTSCHCVSYKLNNRYSFLLNKNLFGIQKIIPQSSIYYMKRTNTLKRNTRS